MTKIVFVFSSPSLRRGCLSSSFSLLGKRKVRHLAGDSCHPQRWMVQPQGLQLLGTKAASWRGWGTVGAPGPSPVRTPAQVWDTWTSNSRMAKLQASEEWECNFSSSVQSQHGSGSWAIQSEVLKWKILKSFYLRAHSGYRTTALSLFFFLICSLFVLWSILYNLFLYNMIFTSVQLYFFYAFDREWSLSRLQNTHELLIKNCINLTRALQHILGHWDLLKTLFIVL